MAIDLPELEEALKPRVIGWINQAIQNAVLSGITLNLPTNVAYTDATQVFTAQQSFAGHIYVGPYASPVDSYDVFINDNFDLTASNSVGVYAAIGGNPTTDVGNNLLAAWFIGQSASGNNHTFPHTIYGVFGDAIHAGGGSALRLQAFNGRSTNSGGGAVGQAIGISAKVTNSGAGTIAAGYGIVIFTPGVTAGTITATAGIAIDTQAGPTNHTDILLGGTVIPAGNYGIYNGGTATSYYAGPITIDAGITFKEIADPASPASGYRTLFAGTAHHFYMKDNSGNVTQVDGGTAGGGTVSSYAKISDTKAANTAGGTFTSGSWQTRVLNTEDSDTDGIVSISSNQFTLGAGTYIIRASAPGQAVNRHKAKLVNVTDSTDTLIGTSEFSNASPAVSTRSEVVGKFSISGIKTFEIQHRCETTNSTTGLGVASNFSVSEVYTVVEIWKVA